MSELRSRLARLQPKADKAVSSAAAAADGASGSSSSTTGAAAAKQRSEVESLMNEAKAIGEDYLQLEKYANLNYMVREGGRGCD